MSDIPNVVLGTLIDPDTFGNPVVDELNVQSRRPGCLLEHNVQQNIATGPIAALTWNSELYDVGGFHSTSVNPSRITVPAGLGGLYLISVWGNWTPSGGGTYRQVFLRLNGSGSFAIAPNNAVPISASLDAAFSTSVMRELNAGDYVEAYGFQDSGVTLGIKGTNSAAGLVGFQAIRLGDLQ